MALESDAGYHGRMKHVFTPPRFPREWRTGNAKVAYVDTKNELASMMTKGLGMMTFKFLRDATDINEKLTVV